MITLTLTRKTRKGKAVLGEMTIPFSQRWLDDPDEKDITAETIENVDYIIPAGNYPLRMTYSPKFRKMMPLIDEVPDREGILIHMGTKPEHSTGCVLTSYLGLLAITAFFNRLNKFFDNEELQLLIRDPLGDMLNHRHNAD